MTFRLSHAYFKFATAALAASVAATVPLSAEAADFRVTDGVFSFTANTVLPGVGLVPAEGTVPAAGGFTIGLPIESSSFQFSDDNGFTFESGSLDLGGVVRTTVGGAINFSDFSIFSNSSGLILDNFSGNLFELDISAVNSADENLNIAGTLIAEGTGFFSNFPELVGSSVGTFQLNAQALDITPEPPAPEPPAPEPPAPEPPAPEPPAPEPPAPEPPAPEPPAPEPPIITPVDPGDDPASVPEPGTVFALLATAGAFFVRKRMS